jgi:hypothetical protein
MRRLPMLIGLGLLCAASWMGQAQTVATTTNVSPTSVVPNLINYSGVLTNLDRKPLTGIQGVTFLLYSAPQGGAPLWLETQNVTADKLGHYTAQLGATSAQGLPADLFKSGEARWLAVQVSGQPEQARVLLVAVPYAMKAVDAETIGGLPPSAFVLAAPPNSNSATGEGTNTTAASNPASAPPPTTSNVTTSGGTANTIPMFTTATNIQNSILTQTGTTAVNVGGRLNLPATGIAKSTAAFNSRPLDFVSSVFNSTTNTPVAQTFQWQAEPLNNDKSTATGTLNLLYASGTANPAETGLKISNKGVFTFAAGQTFPGTGAGTVKSIGLSAPGTDFKVSGSPVTGTGTLTFAWNVAPTNADTASAIVKRDASGNFAASTISAAAVAATGTVSAATLSATTAAISQDLTIPTTTYGFPLQVTSSSSTASTIVGTASSTTGDAWGVEGLTFSSASNAYGVIGAATASSGDPVGVYGYAPNAASGVAVFGQSSGESTTGSGVASLGIGGGVWGDTSVNGNFSVVGTGDNTNAALFVNNSASYDTVFIQNLSTAIPFFAGNGTSLFNDTAYCYIDSSGNINCSGSKNAVVPVDGGAHTVALSAIESPKNWFEDFGSAQLANGSAVVALDSTFMQTVNTEQEYQVFLTPYGDCKGLYASNRTANSFEVHELGGGTASVNFGYRITALRRRYENVRFADHTHDLDFQKKLLQRAKAHGLQPQTHNPTNKPGISKPQMARLNPAPAPLQKK